MLIRKGSEVVRSYMHLDMYIYRWHSPETFAGNPRCGSRKQTETAGAGAANASIDDVVHSDFVC